MNGSESVHIGRQRQTSEHDFLNGLLEASLDTSTSTGRLMLAVIGAIGQAEREGMLERQREGIVRAKREGRYKGRVPTARRCPSLR